MTIVIADTSPINYLVPIDEIGILPRLYHRVVIAEDVLLELMDAGAPPEVRDWMMQYPGWLEIRRVTSHDPCSWIWTASKAGNIHARPSW